MIKIFWGRLSRPPDPPQRSGSGNEAKDRLFKPRVHFLRHARRRSHHGGGRVCTAPTQGVGSLTLADVRDPRHVWRAVRVTEECCAPCEKMVARLETRRDRRQRLRHMTRPPSHPHMCVSCLSACCLSVWSVCLSVRRPVCRWSVCLSGTCCVLQSPRPFRGAR